MHLLPGDALRIVRCQHRRPADVAALFADWLRATEHDIIHERRIELVALGQALVALVRRAAPK